MHTIETYILVRTRRHQSLLFWSQIDVTSEKNRVTRSPDSTLNVWALGGTLPHKIVSSGNIFEYFFF